MEKRITHVGMDAHEDSIKVAMLLPGETKPAEWQLANEQAAVARTVRKVRRLASGEARFCYVAVARELAGFVWAALHPKAA